MAATKRNAGLTSAVHRATLNDEELVSYVCYLPLPTICNYLFVFVNPIVFVLGSVCYK